MAITLIDDDENILELYSDYLEALGYKDIKLYRDSKLFLDNKKLEEIVVNSDVILCDIRMPELDGKDMMEKVIEARNRLRKYVLFIFISGIPKDFYSCTSEGWGALVKADDMIGKPISMGEMKEMLELHGIYPMSEAVDSCDKQTGS